MMTVMLNGIDVTFSTVQREGNYITATLKSFSADQPISSEQPISLVLGSPHTDYLADYQAHPGVKIVEMSPTVWSWIKNNGVHHRATWNYYRCLTHKSVGNRGSLILEDDVHFARGWRRRLDQTIVMLERLYHSGFVLSIYDPWGHEPKASCLYANYRRESFLGTQGVYFPAETREGFAKYLKTHGLIANEKGYDHIMRDYTLKEGLPIFASTPSLIQHLGEKTTGLGYWHRAPNFVEDVSVLSVDISVEATEG